MKFLGVFGVDCFFSKSDAFLTKTPQTDKIARFDFRVLLQSMASVFNSQKRWKLPAKLPQKAAKLPQKPSNSRKSRKVVELNFSAPFEEAGRWDFEQDAGNH